MARSVFCVYTFLTKETPLVPTASTVRRHLNRRSAYWACAKYDYSHNFFALFVNTKNRQPPAPASDSVPTRCVARCDAAVCCYGNGRALDAAQRDAERVLPPAIGRPMRKET